MKEGREKNENHLQMPAYLHVDEFNLVPVRQIAYVILGISRYEPIAVSVESYN